MSERSIPVEILEAALRGDGTCPSPAQIHAAWMAAESEPDALAAIESHAAGCPACSVELELVRSYEASGVDGEAAAEDVAWVVGELRRRRPSGAPAAPGLLRWRRLAPPSARHPAGRGWAIAAGLVFVAGLTWLVAGQRLLPPVAPPPTADVVRSSSIRVLSAMGDLGAPPEQVDWEAVPRAVVYRVRLTGVDGREIWSGESREAKIALPLAVRERLESEVLYRLRVSAFGDSGVRIGDSGEIELRILAAVPRRRDR